jgi:filamentous hemagglutinin family protein
MKHAARIHKPLRPHPLALELSRAFTASAMLAAMPLALAAPQGGTVTAGQAAIQHNGALTTITQGSQRAAIDWRSFNVGAAETVNFVQPNASSAILNRVVGNDPSAIFGRITANGQVMLINPNGILFGRTAQVDVGALTATTSNLSNADFMAGRLQFTEPGRPGATVENQGRITVAEGGFAALVGRQVANSGVITARLGKVALAGGDAFVLDLYGDKLVNLVVDPAALGALTDAQGQPLAARVDHSGEIVADGGRVQLSVATVRQLVDNLINLSGVVRASSFTQAPGVISLQGDAATRVNVSGTLDTSGESRGGRIEVTGREVNLQPGSLLAATGGQGSIAVGGDWQGRGPLAHAEQVNVAEGALLDAGGGTQGQGGTVVLWSGTRTQFAGRIAAGGGSAGGDGGQVEVSSKGTLGFQGEVDVFAANGRQGALLLDPLNLTIAATGSGDSQIAADQLRYFLTRGASVTLSADNNVTVDAEVNGLVSGGGGVAGGGLTLTAGNNLSVNQNIVLNNGALNLTATNGTLTQADGTVLYTGSGAATLRGGAGVDLGQVLSGGAVDIRSANGAVNVRNALVAATSNGSAAPLATLNIEGAGADTLNGALVQGNATVRSVGAEVGLAGAVLQTNAGHLSVTAGTTLTTSASNIGLVSGGTIAATAGQAIDLGAVISTGMATLTSSGAGVTVRQAVTGAGVSAAEGLTVNAAGAVALAGANTGAGGVNITTTSGNITSLGSIASQGGLVSTGNVILHADAGQVGTTAAPINVQAGGNVLLDGHTGVTAATVLARGTVGIEADAGSVRFVADASATPTLRPITGAGGVPTSVSITARDAIDVAGASAGSGGITIDSSAGTVTLRNASLFSNGPVRVEAEGAVTLLDGAGIATTGATGGVTVTSNNGTLTLGNGGIRAEGDAVDVTLRSRGDMNINGDIQTRSGTIDLGSADGAVTVLASYDDASLGANATLDAGNHASRSIIRVNGQNRVEVGELIAYNSVDVSSDAGDVVFKRGLGGDELGTFNGNQVHLRTGYVDYARGYLEDYRPVVGRLVVRAAGSVELNGLNLDGNESETSLLPGLSVTAGRYIVSNNEIAVNKGDIELTSTGTGATDGVYLGNSVYSRGYDRVVGGVHQKTGYGIRISGRTLGLFDNTLEMARLPVDVYTLSWTEGTTPRTETVDAAGFVVDDMGVRMRTAGGNYQMAGFRSDATSTGIDDIRVFEVNAAGVELSSGLQVRGVQGNASEYTDANREVAVPQPTEIAKIEIANNVANYQDYRTGTGAYDNRGRLVAATTVIPGQDRNIVVGSGSLAMTVAGVAEALPRTVPTTPRPYVPGTPIRIGNFAPRLTSLHTTPVQTNPVQSDDPDDPVVRGATQGIGLKLLGFEESGDISTRVWSSRVHVLVSGGNFFLGGFNIDNAGYPSSVRSDGGFTVAGPARLVRTYEIGGVLQPPEEVPITAEFLFQFNSAERTQAELISMRYDGSLPSTPLPSGATLVSDWRAVALPSTGTPGTRVSVRLIDAAPPTVPSPATPGIAQGTPGVAYGVDVRAAVYPSYPGGSATTGLQSGGQVNPDFRSLRPAYLYRLFETTGEPYLDSVPSDGPRSYQLSNIVVDSIGAGSLYGTDTIGTRVFVFDGVIDSANGRRQTDSFTGVIVPGGTGIPGFNNSTVGFAGVGTGFSLATGTAGNTGAGTASGVNAGGVLTPGGQGGGGVPPSVDDRSSQDIAGGVTADPGAAGLGTGDVIFGSRPAGQADLGRGGAVPGSAVNVFKKRYRLATSSNASVCAPGVVQSTPAEGGAARECAGP